MIDPTNYMQGPSSREVSDDDASVLWEDDAQLRVLPTSTVKAGPCARRAQLIPAARIKKPMEFTPRELADTQSFTEVDLNSERSAWMAGRLPKDGQTQLLSTSASRLPKDEQAQLLSTSGPSSRPPPASRIKSPDESDVRPSSWVGRLKKDVLDERETPGFEFKSISSDTIEKCHRLNANGLSYKVHWVEVQNPMDYDKLGLMMVGTTVVDLKRTDAAHTEWHRGDVIVEVNGWPCMSFTDIVHHLLKAQHESLPLVFTVVRRCECISQEGPSEHADESSSNASIIINLDGINAQGNNPAKTVEEGRNHQKMPDNYKQTMTEIQVGKRKIVCTNTKSLDAATEGNDPAGWNSFLVDQTVSLPSMLATRSEGLATLTTSELVQKNPREHRFCACTEGEAVFGETTDGEAKISRFPRYFEEEVDVDGEHRGLTPLCLSARMKVCQVDRTSSDDWLADPDKVRTFALGDPASVDLFPVRRTSNALHKQIPAVADREQTANRSVPEDEVESSPFSARSTPLIAV